MKILIFIGALSILTKSVLGQVFVDPAPGNNTVCANQQIIYSASPPANGCSTYTWTITNGYFQFSSNPKETVGNPVRVVWNNVSAVGKLKVTVTCGTETFVEEHSYPIASVSGITPENPKVTS